MKLCHVCGAECPVLPDGTLATHSHCASASFRVCLGSGSQVGPAPPGEEDEDDGPP